MGPSLAIILALRKVRDSRVAVGAPTILCNDFFILFLFFVVGVQTRELERPATVMIYKVLNQYLAYLFWPSTYAWQITSSTAPRRPHYLCYPGRGDPGVIEMKKKTQARSQKTVRGRERSWSRFGAQLSMKAAGTISRDGNSLIGHTYSVLVSSTMPFNGVMSVTMFSDRQQRCPRFHHLRFPAMVRTRM